MFLRCINISSAASRSFKILRTRDKYFSPSSVNSKRRVLRLNNAVLSLFSNRDNALLAAETVISKCSEASLIVPLSTILMKV